MTSGFLVQIIFDAMYALGEGGRCPGKIVFGSQKLSGGLVDIYRIFQPDHINLSDLPSGLELTPTRLVDLGRKYRSLVHSCFYQKILSTHNIYGIEVDLTATPSNEQVRLIQEISGAFDLSYDEEELTNGKSIAFLLIGLIELFGSDFTAPDLVYLDFQQGCFNGESSLVARFEDICLAIESEVSPYVHNIKEFLAAIWQRALIEKIIVMEGPFLARIHLRAEVSEYLEKLCDQLIELLGTQNSEDNSSNNEEPDQPDGEETCSLSSAETDNPVAEIIQNQLGLPLQ